MDEKDGEKNKMYNVRFKKKEGRGVKLAGMVGKIRWFLLRRGRKCGLDAAQGRGSLNARTGVATE